jgi:HEAT repeat protein
MCERAMTDPEPLLRSAAMTLTWHLADHLPNAFLGDASKGSRYLRRLPSREDPIFPDVYLLQCKLLPVATRLAEDRAPQVRLAVAAQCERLCDALGDHWSSVIIDVLVALLTDSDERVRIEAVLCVPRLADVVLLSSPPGVIPAGESSVLDALLPAAIKLQKDSSASVRIALATTAGEMLTLLVGLQQAEEARPKESEEDARVGSSSIRFQKRHVDERLIPLVQKLLHDSDPEVTSSALRAVTNASRGAAREMRARVDTEDDDSMSVSSLQSYMSMEKKDPVFLPVLSEEQVLRLLPTLSELANSKQWRVRQSAVEIVPALLGCTTKFESRADIARLCVRLTGDTVVERRGGEC